MLKIEATSGKEPFSPDVQEECRSVEVWALWAHGAAEEALQWPIDELGAEMTARPDYRAKIQEIFKMLLIERAAARWRDQAAEAMCAHVRAALKNAGCDDPDALFYAPIDYATVPRFRGADPADFEYLRPSVRRDG